MKSTLDIGHLARLAALRLTDAETTQLQKEFSAILDFVDTLAQARADNLAATSQVTGLENIFAPDMVEKSIHQRTLIELAPARQGQLVRVPGVFTDGPPA